jgi:hypothetical protein
VVALGAALALTVGGAGLAGALVVVSPPVASAAPGDYPSTVMASSPTAYWRLGDAPGSSSLADASGNGNPLTSVSDVTLGRPGAVASDLGTNDLDGVLRATGLRKGKSGKPKK